MTKDEALKNCMQLAYSMLLQGSKAPSANAIYNICKEALQSKASDIPMKYRRMEYNAKLQAEVNDLYIENKRLKEALEQPTQKPLTQEKYEQLKNQSTQWTSSLPMFVHLINKHFGIDDGLDWGQE
jgi:FtsZ-binding cell division protein ZapB